MSCWTPSMREMIFEHDMQLKIITQNKPNISKLCFLKIITSVLPSSCSFLCVLLSLYASCLASYFSFWLEEGYCDWGHVYCMVHVRKTRITGKAFFHTVLNPIWVKGGRMDRIALGSVALGCGLVTVPLRLCQGCAWEHPCSCALGTISSALWMENSSMSESKNPVN